MTEKHKHDIDSENRFVWHAYFGETNEIEMIDGWRRVLEDPRFDGSYRFLTDLRGAELKLSWDGIKTISEYLTGKFTGRSAILVTTPQQVALASLHIKNIASTRSLELFSTEEAALTFLGIAKS